MPKHFDEGCLRFTFSDDWQVEKYDDHGVYRRKLASLTGTKAIDFVGCCDNEAFFIEVKDFRGHSIENKKRYGSNLAEEVASKLRDTLAGIVGGARNHCDASFWHKLLTLAANGRRRCHVVLWLEDDAPKAGDEKVRLSVQTKGLAASVAWLTRKALVTNQANAPLPGVCVDNLHGAGQPHSLSRTH